MAQSRKSVSIEQRNFAENFKLARQTLKLSQAEVGKLSNITQEFVSNFERSVTGIGIDTMSALSSGLRIPLYLLVDPAFKVTYDFSRRLAIWKSYQEEYPVPDGKIRERLIFGQNFKTSRLALKLTQQQVFERTGFQQGTLAGVERAEIGLEFNTALNLASAVGKTLHSLLTP